MTADDPTRMRFIDSIWMDLDNADAPIAVGAVLEFAGRAPSEARVRQRIAEITDASVRLRQVPVSSRSGVLQPKWEEVDPDLEVHVVRESTPDLAIAVSDIMARPMPMDRPLWDLTILTGYAAREWAAVWRIHHSIADGEGVTMLIGRTLDMEPEGGTTLTDWMVSQVLAMKAAAQAEQADGDGGGESPMDKIFGAVKSAAGTAATVAVTTPATVRALLRLAPALPSEISGKPAAGRDWRGIHIPLEEVKLAGKANGGTVNDVLMSAVANGFREVIVAGGGDPTDRVVRAVMPVSLRSPGDTRSNNQVSMIPVELPVGVADAKERLGAVVRQTRQGKKSMVPMVVGAVNDTLDKILPAPIMEAMVPRFSWAFGWVSDTLVTNVRGPSDPYYFLGQEVLYVSPIIPIGSSVRTVVGINSYNGSVNVAVTGDMQHGTDNQILLDGIVAGVAELLED